MSLIYLVDSCLRVFPSRNRLFMLPSLQDNRSAMKKVAVIAAEHVAHLNSFQMCPVCLSLQIQLINLRKTEKF